MVWTSSGLTQTHTHTGAGDDKIQRPKLALGKNNSFYVIVMSKHFRYFQHIKSFNSLRLSDAYMRQ